MNINNNIDLFYLRKIININNIDIFHVIIKNKNK